MIRLLITMMIGAGILGTPLSVAGEQGVVAPGATIQLVADGFKFTEGPTCDAEGNLFFTDQPNDRILRWSAEGELTTFLQPAGRANGMYFAADGQLVACADEKNELWAIDPAGDVEMLWKGYGDKPLNGPNDVWIHPNGGTYFTDPFYKRPWWEHESMPQDGQHVYYLAPGADSLVRVTHDLAQPNGIIGTADGTTLYVADIGAKQTWRYAIRDNGTLGEKTLLCAHGSDGMTIDDVGNVYLTGDGVRVFGPDGEQIDHIAVDAPWTANVSFCGADRQTLFITASTGLYSVRTRTRAGTPSK